MKALGEKAVDRVADPGGDERGRRPHLADVIAQTKSARAIMRPDRNEIRNISNAGPGMNLLDT